MSRQIPTNLKFACESFNNPKLNGIILEGSSGSRKTYSLIDFLVLATTYHDYRINIIKQTYNSFKTTLYYDFGKRLDELNIRNPFSSVQDISSYKLFNSKISFLGADNPNSFTGRCDILWGNEILDIPKAVWLQARQRCERFWIGDMNPKVSDHYVYDFEKRPDVKFLTTTFKDNPFIPINSKLEILSYDPSNPENIKNGTADEYMWKVYGCGERASLTGLIYPDVTWIDKFPEDCPRVSYGMDFGGDHPTAIVKAGVEGNNLYLEGMFYAPCLDPKTLTEVLKGKDGHSGIIGDRHIWADSANPLLISALRSKGVACLAAAKPQGSVADGISIMKQYKIHIVKNVDFKKEADNYKWREVGGIALGEPIKANDDYWDASRYVVVMEFR